MVLWSLYKRFVSCTVLNESLLSGEFQVFRFVRITPCFYQKGQWGSGCRYRHCNFVLYSSFLGRRLIRFLLFSSSSSCGLKPSCPHLSGLIGSRLLWLNHCLAPNVSKRKACWVEASLAAFLLLVGNHWITERSVWTLCK